MIDNEMRSFIMHELSPIKERINTIEKILSDYTDGRHSESMEHINESEDALDALSTEVIPAHDEALSDLESAMDDLLENVIPSLMMGNE